MLDPLVKTPYYVRREAQENNLRMRLESRSIRRARRLSHVYDLVIAIGFAVAVFGALMLMEVLS